MLFTDATGQIPAIAGKPRYRQQTGRLTNQRGLKNVAAHAKVMDDEARKNRRSAMQATYSR